MTGYIVNFGVYTMAMVGIIVVALLVYKKSTTLSASSKSSLKIDEKIQLNARKSLYVVSAGSERFLIAGDMDNTSLIAKLGENTPVSIPVTNPIKYVQEAEEPVERKPFITRAESPVQFKSFKAELNDAEKSLDTAFKKVEPIQFNKYLDVKKIRKKPVMKELARKLAEI